MASVWVMVRSSENLARGRMRRSRREEVRWRRRWDVSALGGGLVVEVEDEGAGGLTGSRGRARHSVLWFRLRETGIGTDYGRQGQAFASSS